MYKLDARWRNKGDKREAGKWCLQSTVKNTCPLNTGRPYFGINEIIALRAG